MTLAQGVTWPHWEVDYWARCKKSYWTIATVRGNASQGANNLTVLLEAAMLPQIILERSSSLAQATQAVRAAADWCEAEDAARRRRAEAIIAEQRQDVEHLVAQSVLLTLAGNDYCECEYLTTLLDSAVSTEAANALAAGTKIVTLALATLGAVAKRANSVLRSKGLEIPTLDIVPGWVWWPWRENGTDVDCTRIGMVDKNHVRLPSESWQILPGKPGDSYLSYIATIIVHLTDGQPRSIRQAAQRIEDITIWCEKHADD